MSDYFLIKVGENTFLHYTIYLICFPSGPDIDECGSNMDTCAEICINTLSGYVCDCFPGYKLSSNGFDCDGKHISFVNIISRDI